MTQPDEEKLTLPEVTSDSTLSDGRGIGLWKTKYGAVAWCQIILECLYLIVILGFSIYGLVNAAQIWLSDTPQGLLPFFLGDTSTNHKMLLWVVIALSGMCGGITFSLKWLYHTVAKNYWNQDRLIWRLTVPVISSILAVFTAAMIGSGIIPLLKTTSLSTPISCAGFGFFIGLFSDNLMAGLRAVAEKLFGTMASPKSSSDTNSNTDS